MDKTFNISVRDRLAKNLSHLDYVCGNTGYMVRFDFDEEWDAYPIKTARFIESSGEHHDVAVIDNQCEFPKIMNTIRVEVGVYAGDLYTTTPAVIGARRSILSTGGDRPAVPEKEPYDQMMEAINADAVRAEIAADAAENAAAQAGEKAQQVFEDNALVVRVEYKDGDFRASHTWREIVDERNTGKPIFASTSDVTYLYYGQEDTDLIFAAMEYTYFGERKGLHAKRMVIHNNNTVSISKATVEMQQGGIDEEQLTNAVREALQEAKDSGLFDGADGEDGGYYKPSVDASGNVSWAASKSDMPAVSATNIKGPKGAAGRDGADGFSPTVNVSKTGKVTTLTITDKNGTKTAEILDGEDGQDGEGGGTGLPTGGEPHQMLVTDADGVAKWEEKRLITGVEDENGNITFSMPLSDMFALGNELANYDISICDSGRDRYRVNYCTAVTTAIYLYCSMIDPSDRLVTRTITLTETSAKFSKRTYISLYNLPIPEHQPNAYLGTDDSGSYVLKEAPTGSASMLQMIDADGVLTFLDMDSGEPTIITLEMLMSALGDNLVNLKVLVLVNNAELHVYSFSYMSNFEDPENPPFILFTSGTREPIRMDYDGTLSYVPELKLATKEYVASVFEQLKELILAGDTAGAVAVLDQAILDNTILA